MVGYRLAFIFGFLFALVLFSCASFGYRHYSLNLEQGVLEADKPENDLPLTVCALNEAGERQCVVMLISEFVRLKTQYERLQKQLEECQSGQ